MPRGLHRFQESGQSHFVTFSCRHRQAYFSRSELFDEFVRSLERMRVRYELRVYGYVVMPEHVHLLVSEPGRSKLADALHYLKLSFSKRLPGLLAQLPQVSAQRTGANLGHLLIPPLTFISSFISPVISFGICFTSGSFWEKRYYDRNVRDYLEFTVKLKYLHRNPVKRGLVAVPEEWKWSSYWHYALREISVVEIESEWTARDRERRNDSAEASRFLIPG